MRAKVILALTLVVGLLAPVIVVLRPLVPPAAQLRVGHLTRPPPQSQLLALAPAQPGWQRHRLLRPDPGPELSRRPACPPAHLTRLVTSSAYDASVVKRVRRAQHRPRTMPVRPRAPPLGCCVLTTGVRTGRLKRRAQLRLTTPMGPNVEPWPLTMPVWCGRSSGWNFDQRAKRVATVRPERGYLNTKYTESMAEPKNLYNGTSAVLTTAKKFVTGGLLIVLPRKSAAGRWGIVEPKRPAAWMRSFLTPPTSVSAPTSGIPTD